MTDIVTHWLCHSADSVDRFLYSAAVTTRCTWKTRTGKLQCLKLPGPGVWQLWQLVTDGIVLRFHSAIELLVDAAGAELNTKNRYMQLLGPEN